MGVNSKGGHEKLLQSVTLIEFFVLNLILSDLPTLYTFVEYN